MEPEPSRGNHLLIKYMTGLTRTLRSVFCLLAVPAGLVYAQAPVSSSNQPTGTLEQRVERIERMMQSQGLLEILQQLQQLQQDISQLRGEIETHNYNLEQLTRRQRDLYADMDQRLQRLEGGTTVPAEIGADTVSQAGVDTPPLETLDAIQETSESPTGIPSLDSPLQVEIVGTSAMQQQTPAETNTTVTQTESLPAQTAGTTDITTRPANADPLQLQAEYQQAFNLLRQSLYDQAIKAFQQFLTAHPNDRYSDNAQYWLAETYFVTREFPLALEEYNKVVTNFPESQKVSDAMLKIGFTMIELGQLDNARQHLQALIRQQPDSTVARLAEERLKQLGSATQESLPQIQAN